MSPLTSAPAGEDRPGLDGRVLVPLLEEDPVGVGRPPARAPAPVGVADELDQLARLVADAVDRAGGVVLDHVRPRCDLVQAVGRHRLVVELARVLSEARGPSVGCASESMKTPLGRFELEHERVPVGRLDPADAGHGTGAARRRADDVSVVRARVAVGDAGREAALDRVLHVRGGHLAVHGRAEADAVADAHGHRLAAVRDLRHRGGEIGDRLDARRLVGEQGTLGRVGDLVGERVVRGARVDVVDVAGGEHGDRAAARGRGGAAPSFRPAAAAAATPARTSDQCRDRCAAGSDSVDE